MTMSRLVPEHPDQIAEQVSRQLNLAVTDIERISGGLNSRVYRAHLEGGLGLLIKTSFSDSEDRRDRLGNEFTAMNFLWDSGLRCIPRPITLFDDRTVSIYEFVVGQSFDEASIDEQDIDDAAEFFRRLTLLRDVPEARHFGPASEACFTIQELLDNIQQRKTTLVRHGNITEEHVHLNRFLKGQFAEAFEQLSRRAIELTTKAGVKLESELTAEYKILSPSDFGFHNARRDAAGRTVYFDFEYFGWDDPAKTISDFRLHPAMVMTDELRDRFERSLLSMCRNDEALRDRLHIVQPLYGLKWCMIFCNEFLPSKLNRRRFAVNDDRSAADIRLAQLAKAKDMLQKSLGLANETRKAMS